MTNLKAQLLKLNKNLRALEEREAKYGGNAPLELLNQIEDHQTAVDLYKDAIMGDITEAGLREGLAPLNLAIAQGDNVVTGDINGSIVAMGKGAQIIINQAKSALEQAQEQDTFEDRLLCESIAQIAINLQNQISPFVAAPGSENDGKSTFVIKKTGSLLSGGKLRGSPYKLKATMPASSAWPGVPTAANWQPPPPTGPSNCEMRNRSRK